MFKKDPCLKLSASPHSPHSIIPRLVEKNTQLLDVGCNTGFIGRVLKRKKVFCDGIDINDKALRIAKKIYEHVYKRDLYSSKLNIPRKKYDYIVFADVIEHIPRPDLLLKDSISYLKKTGVIIISLPNVARAEIRFQLLLGNFNYTYGGILSEDHLRHFTRKSAIKMMEECGLEVINTILTGLGHIVRIFPTLTAFQFVYVCQLSFLQK